MFTEISPSLFNDTFLPLDRLPQKYQDGLTTEHLSRIGDFSGVHVTNYEESMAEHTHEIDINEHARSLNPDSESDTASERSEMEVFEDVEWRDACELMCDVLNRLLQVLEAPYAMTVTDHSSRARRGPELCMYPTPDTGETSNTKTSWGWLVTLFDVRMSARHAPFNYDAGPLVEPDTPEAQSAREQLANHVAEVMRHQHRLFFFMVAIQSDRVRLMRWDRAGVVVSHAFNYKESPLPLLDFVFRVATCGRVEQGYDPSVRPAEPQEIELLKQHHSRVQDAWLKEAVEDIFSDPARYPVYAITCPDLPVQHNGLDLPGDGSKRTHIFLVGRFKTASRSPTGHGTKTYVAYDVDRGRVAFLKDVWTPDHPHSQPESAVYYKLHAAGVQHIATAYAGGVVPGANMLDRTLESLVNAPLGEQRRFPLLHDRIVVKEIGRPLNTFASAEHLVRVIYDAFQGHKEAWEKAHILHGDISSSNILINCETDNGLLIDWDLCKAEEHLGEGHNQQGTWMFGSSMLLNFPLKPHGVSDDLESFVHVMTDQILRHFLHHRSSVKRIEPINHSTRDDHTKTHLTQGEDEQQLGFELDELQVQSNEGLANYYKSMYLGFGINSDGFPVDNGYKWTSMRLGKPGVIFLDGSGRMGALLGELYQLFGDAYRSLNRRHLWRAWGTRWVQGSVSPPAIPAAINTHAVMDAILHKYYSFARTEHSWGYKKTIDQVRGLSIYGQRILENSAVGPSKRALETDPSRDTKRQKPNPY